MGEKSPKAIPAAARALEAIALPPGPREAKRKGKLRKSGTLPDKLPPNPKLKPEQTFQTKRAAINRKKRKTATKEERRILQKMQMCTAQAQETQESQRCPADFVLP